MPLTVPVVVDAIARDLPRIDPQAALEVGVVQVGAGVHDGDNNVGAT